MAAVVVEAAAVAEEAAVDQHPRRPSPASRRPAPTAPVASPVADAASVGSQTPTQAASATAGLPSQTTPASFQASAQPLSSPPIAFELNQGQAPAPYTFDSRGPGYNLLLSPAQAVLNLPASASTAAQSITMSFVGAGATAATVGQQQLAYRSNYFLGSQAISDIPNYAQVQVQNLYTGIGLTYYGNTAGQLEYDVNVAPGASLSEVRMQYTGVASMHTDSAGNLVMQTSAGSQIVEHAPSLYQLAADGSRTPVTGKFVLNNDGTIGFAAGAYDPNSPLIVDPTLDYSTYWGTSGTDTGTSVAVDGNGNAFITGGTPSLSGSTTNVYVAKFDAAGNSLLYITYLGSASNAAASQANALGVDPAGNAVVVGITGATDYPTTSGAVQTTSSGGTVGFVTRLNATGDALLYSTYWKDTTPNGVAVNALGQAFVTGTATSGMTTTSGAYQTSIGAGSTLGFVAGFSADGTSLLYSSYFGGTGYGLSVTARAIALDTAGNAYVTGSTSSSSFPTTTGAYQRTYGGGTDAFVLKLNAAGSALDYATFLGGSASDTGYAVAVDRSGNAYLTGTTFSTNFPTTTGAYQTTSAGTNDAFVSKLNASGSALVYSTYLGGSAQDQGNGIAVAPDSTVLVAGVTSSSNFPNVNPLAGTGSSPSSQAFLSKLNSAGTALAYSTYLETSTSAGTSANAVVMDPSGYAFVTGNANGTFLTTTGAYQTTYGGGYSDAFAMKINASLEAPVITAISPDNGVSASDFITDSPNISISGTAPPSITVEVFMDSVPIGTTTSNSGGSWSFDYSGTTLPDGTYAFTALTESGSLTSPLSATQLVTIDTTAPSVLVTVPVTTSLTPIVDVQASDLAGIPANATVTLDVDLNNDGNFTDSGETGYTSGTLVNGFVAIPVALERDRHLPRPRPRHRHRRQRRNEQCRQLHHRHGQQRVDADRRRGPHQRHGGRQSRFAARRFAGEPPARPRSVARNEPIARSAADLQLRADQSASHRASDVDYGQRRKPPRDHHRHAHLGRHGADSRQLQHHRLRGRHAAHARRPGSERDHHHRPARLELVGRDPRRIDRHCERHHLRRRRGLEPVRRRLEPLEFESAGQHLRERQ